MADQTPAQRLLSEHMSHQPTVEEVVDEEDIAHPPPSSVAPVSEPASNPLASNGAAMSAKAAGKQRAPDAPLSDVTNQKPTTAAFDVKSEEAFPSLGGPKPKVAQPTAWGTPPPSAARENGLKANGTAGDASSGTSTPVSDILTPSSKAPNVYPARSSGATQQISIPGRYTEDMKMPFNQMKSRADLKKPIADMLKDINRRSKAKVEMSRSGNSVSFRGQGPTVDAVQAALKEVAAHVGATQNIKLPIPSSVRPHIIGRGGTTIQNIVKRSGARIQMPRNDTKDDDTMIEIEIEGNPVSVAMARSDIENIVNQRTSSVNSRLKDIPPELYPFLAGPHNSKVNTLEEGRDVRIKIPHYHTWENVPPPQPTGNGQALDLQPRDGYHIQISGERDAVRAAQAELERHAQELQQQLTASQISVERGFHQFIVGERGGSLNDFLSETGCSIIMPPPSEDSEILTIVGPPEHIEKGVNRAMDLAGSMSAARIDVAKQHRSGPDTHARDLARYLQQRQALLQFEQLYDAHVVFPRLAEESDNWQVFSRDPKSTMRARSDIINLVNAHPPARFRNVHVHPFYQRQLQQRHGQQVRDQFGVHMVNDDMNESPQVLLIYEGPGPAHEYVFPRSAPTNDELAEFEKALQAAEEHLLEQIGPQEEILERSLSAPIRYREKIQRQIKRETENTPGGLHPVQFLGLDQAPAENGEDFPLAFRGPTSTLDEQAAILAAFIEQQIREEAERDYITSFEFPQKFANVLIGKRGENINRLREEFDVDIQVNDGKVDVKGPQAKADAARAHIVALAKKLEDETTHQLKINPKFHGDLIGPKGSQVIKLQDRYNCRIIFPRTSPSPADDQSVADDVSDVGPAASRRPPQAPDTVIIRGPRKGADEARDELWSLFQYLQENSYTGMVSVAQSQLPSLIGQGGRELDSLRLSTGAQIDVPGSKETADPSGRVDIKLRGTKTAVENARKLLEERAKAFDETITRDLDVEKRHHRALIGREGENIRQIITQAGATGDPRTLARVVQFPRADAAENAIKIQGSPEVVQKIIEAIESFVKLREDQVTESVEVPQERHGALIGRGGETRRKLQSEFNIVLAIPSASTTGPSSSVVKISGLPSDVEKAKAKIQSMLKTQEGETLSVPKRLHHAIADTNDGNFFRNLNRDLRVTVDHGGQPKPPRPQAPAPTPPATAAKLPLITDPTGETDAAASDPADQHNFSTAPLVPAASEDDPTIPWILKGPDADAVAKAKARIEAAMTAADTSVIGFLDLPDPSTHRYVIGPGGATIDGIRRASGCKIDVPKRGGAGAPIEIRGQPDGVELAKQMALEAVEKGLAPKR